MYKGIKDVPSHLRNIDETGCQNIHKADSGVGVTGKPSYNLTALEKGETSTALVTINAVGYSPPVMIIHKGKYIGEQWSNGVPHDTLVQVSDKGYMNRELFVEFCYYFVKYHGEAATDAAFFWSRDLMFTSRDVVIRSCLQ